MLTVAIAALVTGGVSAEFVRHMRIGARAGWAPVPVAVRPLIEVWRPPVKARCARP